LGISATQTLCKILILLDAFSLHGTVAILLSESAAGFRFKNGFPLTLWTSFAMFET